MGVTIPHLPLERRVPRPLGEWAELAAGVGVDPTAASFKGSPVRRHSRETGTGRECRPLSVELQRLACALALTGSKWCPQDGIEPPSTAYKAVILPLNDAGIGVIGED